MPNWTSNRICSDNPNVIYSLCNGYNVDFNQLIPMPDVIKNTEYSAEERRYIAYYILVKFGYKSLNEYGYTGTFESDEDAYKFFNSITDFNKNKFFSKGQKYYFNKTKYDAYDWYDWSNKNWGTNWNACRSYVWSKEANFVTALCMPYRVMETLFAKFPNDKIIWSYTNSDGPYGKYENQNGVPVLIWSGVPHYEC